MAYRRPRANSFQMCSEVSPLGSVRVIRHVTRELGDLLVASRKARPITAADGTLLGYQMLAAEQKASPYRESTPSSAAMSRAETEAVAGLRGQSRTVKLTEEQRKSRCLRRLSEMDLVQSANVKLAAIGGDVKAFRQWCPA